jgi:hypothetical protein
MPRVTALEMHGSEYDWIALDRDGFVGFFSTAGGGYAPEAFLEDVDAFDRAIAAMLRRPASTAARSCVSVPNEAGNDWRFMAERGVFGFDADLHGGPYRRVAVPERAIRVDELPEDVGRVAGRIWCHWLTFAGCERVTGDELARNLGSGPLGQRPTRRDPS